MSLDLDLVGNAMQMAVCRLQPGQTVYCEAGKFLFSTGGLTPVTRLSKPSAAGAGQQGGMLQGLMRTALDAGKRMLAGESLAFQYFTNNGREPEVLSFAGVLPGEMRALELNGGRGWYAEKDAFIAAESTVDFDIAFSGLRQGFAGGEGFILEKFTGYGTVLIGGAGNFIDLNLDDFGGLLKVDTGCIVAFEEGVRYDITRVGGLNMQGLMTMAFGHEGMNLASLSGSGRVILQSMTIEGLATALRKNLFRAGNENNGRTGMGAIGGLFGGID
jgi:uncharacterized protein (AIM24 family)